MYFDTGNYFKELDEDTFYPYVEVSFYQNNILQL